MSELTSTSGKHIFAKTRAHFHSKKGREQVFLAFEMFSFLKLRRSSMILYAFIEGTDGASPFLARSSYRTGPSRYEELKRKVGIDPLIAIGKGPKKQTQSHCGFCLNNGAQLIMRWLSNTGNKFGSI